MDLKLEDLWISHVEEKERMPVQKTDRAVSRKSLLAFWILGLCNNYGYVVMLCAASNIINQKFEFVYDYKNPLRNCNTISTGAIVLADIVPTLVIKLIAPFLPLWIHFRMTTVLLLSITGFILAAEAYSGWIAIAGVVAISFSSGLGEATMLSYMGLYKSTNVISCWSSGTGGAGFFGSISYMAITFMFAEEDQAKLMNIFLVVPVLMGISFWFLLEKPECDDASEEKPRRSSTSSYCNNPRRETQSDRFLINMKYIPSLFKYMIPLCLVFLFQYFINHGMYELIQFPRVGVNVKDQYVLYNCYYQVGVFMSRSSLNVLPIKRTWILALLQAINVAIFTTFAIFFNFVPSIYIIFILSLFEGFIGGAAYVNTYNRIQHEIEDDKLMEFSMGMTSLAQAIGIYFAACLVIPAHNAICILPKYILKP